MKCEPGWQNVSIHVSDKGVHGKKFSLEEQQQKKWTKRRIALYFISNNVLLIIQKFHIHTIQSCIMLYHRYWQKNKHFFHIYYNFFLFFFSYNSSVMLKFAHIQLSHGQIINTWKQIGIFSKIGVGCVFFLFSLLHTFEFCRDTSANIISFSLYFFLLPFNKMCDIFVPLHSGKCSQTHLSSFIYGYFFHFITHIFFISEYLCKIYSVSSLRL